MALEIVWSEEAENQLSEIIEYLENEWSEKEIRNFFVRLEESLYEISKNPDTYKNSTRKPGTKEFQHSKQTTIFYTYDQKNVNILLLWPNKQNPDKI